MEPAIKHNFTALYLFYVTGILLFILTATGLIYYSLGYRYDFDKGQIFQTGILRLYPITSQYSIVIDDTPVPSDKLKRTTEITNLLPKEHFVKISAPEYQDWSKTVLISPETVTNESDILLIPNQPKTDDQLVFNSFSYNPDSNFLAYNANSALMVTDINTIDNPTIFSDIKLTANTQFKWIEPQLLVLLNTNPESSEIIVLNVVNSNQTELQIPYQISTEQIIGLDPNHSNIIYIYRENQIFAYDLNHKNSEEIIFSDISHPQIDQNQLYYQQEDSIFVFNYNLNTEQEFSVGSFDNFYLTPFPEYIILTSADSNQLFNLNQMKKIFDFSGQIEQITHSPELNILIKTQTELIIIDFYHQPISYQTILRISSPIKEAGWYNNHNIFYTVDNEIKRIETDGNNQQTILSFANEPIKFIAGNNKINTVLNSNGQQLLQTIYLTQESS